MVRLSGRHDMTRFSLCIFLLFTKQEMMKDFSVIFFFFYMHLKSPAILFYIIFIFYFFYLGMKYKQYPLQCFCL